MKPLFRTDQVGSLIRPASLLSVRQSSQIYSDALSGPLEAATGDAIAAAVAKQLELSIRPLTSGEFERTIFYSGFFENLSGMTARLDEPIPDAFRPGFPTIALLQRLGVKTRSTVVATGKIAHVQPAYLQSWELLKRAVPRDTWPQCKLALPSITYEHMSLARGTAWDAGVYGSDREYFTDLAAAYRAEIRALYDAGLRSVQIDDPNLTFFVVDSFLDALRADGVDPDALLDEYIWAHNECLRDRPADLHVGVHLCRGNFPASMGVAAGSYEGIAEKLFARLDFDTFYLEFDDERSGGFEPLRFLPRGKNVVLGVVSTKVAELEDLDVLAARVREAAEVIARGQGRTADEVLDDSLAVSPQCGFASLSHGKGVGMTEERMWEKLVLVRDLARKVFKDAV